ncbi:MAG TPA: DNA mismatch repair endonuclease MutL [Verrucomicrobiae bacterium]|jgi:DNA mismatch repair protein MutL|nr:DNA mismatch repair endonuclease MutL [Verrucomicrobiae bacterium]
MNRIRLLPDQVANQIAAGEVVERPASVVKELVENAIDAQAARITVEIQAGGRSLIRVIDDGVGMNRDDALLSLERHATSKLRRAEDLASISTMGFRGEAIPSIASVSRMTITTRERESENPEGTQIVINGGKILEVKAAGIAPGTSIEVRQIFFNLPARRKFLRSEETEKAHIQQYLTLVALSQPQIACTFVQDGRIVWQLPAVPGAELRENRIRAVEERFAALYSHDIDLVPLEFSTSIQDHFVDETGAVEGAEPVQVWGIIGAPGVSRSTRDDQHVFVNRRPVENRGLNFALLEGYHTMLMKGRYPLCCLFLELNPALVDVNIHPAKREVKFRQEFAVRRVMTEAVRDALKCYHTRKEETVPRAPIKPLHSAGTEPFHLKHPEPVPETRTFPNFVPSLPNHPISSWPRREEPRPPGTYAAVEIAPSSPATTLEPAPEPPRITVAPPKPVPPLEVPLRFLGVIGRLYVALESDRGLVLLDQHAAHERVLFEQMLQRVEQGDAPSQRLLLPETIELSPRDSNFVRQIIPMLSRLGVGLNEFGDRTFLLDALPPFVKASSPKKFVLELIDALKTAGQEVNSWRLGEDVVAKTVCRHAVKANDPLAQPEIEHLIEDLRRCAMPYTCPHGRPTLIEMNFRELEKKFGRTG